MEAGACEHKFHVRVHDNPRWNTEARRHVIASCRAPCHVMSCHDGMSCHDDNLRWNTEARTHSRAVTASLIHSSRPHPAVGRAGQGGEGCAGERLALGNHQPLSAGPDRSPSRAAIMASRYGARAA